MISSHCSGNIQNSPYIWESFFLVGGKVSQLRLTFVTGGPGKIDEPWEGLKLLLILKSAHHSLSYMKAPFTPTPSRRKTHFSLMMTPFSFTFGSHFYQFYLIIVFLFLNSLFSTTKSWFMTQSQQNRLESTTTFDTLSHHVFSVF